MRLVFAFLMTLGISVFAQKNQASKEVSEIMKIQEKAWNNFDIDGFMAHYWNNDSLMFIGSKGITYGWKQTLANYKKNYNSKELMGVLTFINYKYDVVSNNTVYVIGKWQINRNETQIGGHYTLLWKKINNKWVIVCDHTS